jgi:2-octaprenylphenol hydroxylase
MPNQKKSYDIMIVGGGMVGMSIAIALAKQTHLSIAILEANPENGNWSDQQYHHRVSAISLASVRIFRALDVWDDIRAKRVSPFHHIHVWDGLGNGKIDFDSRDVGESVLGYIIENTAIQSALLAKVKQLEQITYVAPVHLKSVQSNNEAVTIVAEDDREYTAKLVIAADGAHSWLRQQANIDITKTNYDQKAIVATVKTTLPHRKTANQVFLETGPLAFLPLADEKTSSIVWSLPTEAADTLLSVPDEDFILQLASAFSHHLGDVSYVSKRYAFPLQKQQASTYFNSRIVLAGDAAHTVHPLAGQGINMGLLDAASLVQLIVDAYKKQRDFASITVLRQYERWRKADNAGLLTGVDVIKHLFASDKKTIQAFRSHGLSITDAMPLIKNIFIRHAVGNRGDLPMMAR